VEPNQLVFLRDVDNTLLDNDRVAARHPERDVGKDRSRRYWPIFEELRTEFAYADYLGALQRYRIEHPRDQRLLPVSYSVVSCPYANRQDLGSLDAIELVSRRAPAVILFDGDVVFQPRTVDRSGEAVNGHFLDLGSQGARARRRRAAKPGEALRACRRQDPDPRGRQENLGHARDDRLRAPRHYALDAAHVARHPPADLTTEPIIDLLHIDIPSLEVRARLQE
jgi:hypothetical protein